MTQKDVKQVEQVKAPTVLELRHQAKELGIKNFGRMKKSELQEAIDDVRKQAVRNEAPVDESVSLTENITEASHSEQDYSTQKNAIVRVCNVPTEITLLSNSGEGCTLPVRLNDWVDTNKIHDEKHDYIDVEFCDVSDDVQNETHDDWKLVFEAMRKEQAKIQEVRNRIMHKFLKRKKNNHVPLRKSETLPHQLTIKF